MASLTIIMRALFSGNVKKKCFGVLEKKEKFQEVLISLGKME